jgi:hypothetical protein
MRVLLACEHTASLRSEFQLLGHDAWSCDLKPCTVTGNHYQGDVFDLINEHWDLVVAFPPCTYLAKAQLWRCLSDERRWHKQQRALMFVRDLYNSFPRIAIENPIGHLNTHWKSPGQIIKPFYFGDPYSKEICLWLKDCPPIISTLYSVLRKPVSNHVNSRMSPALKSEIKSSWSHYPLMCKAIADQWNSLPLIT